MPGAPDATRFQGVTARLYTRRELADLLRPITKVPADPRAAAALAYCRRLLAPEIGMPDEPYPDAATSAPIVTGFAEAVTGGRDDLGMHLRSHGELLGRGRLLGTLGRDGPTRSASPTSTGRRGTTPRSAPAATVGAAGTTQMP